MEDSILQAPLEETAQPGGKRTAKRAVDILRERGYLAPSKERRWALAAIMARHQRILYGDAFDVVKLPPGIDLNDDAGLDRAWKELRFFEVKSTGKKSVKDDWSGYFFSLSTAELLTAQNLRGQYRFIFVNTLRPTAEPRVLTLQQLFARAGAIYPTWSISFGKPREAEK